jgi:hypothetical protein
MVILDYSSQIFYVSEPISYPACASNLLSVQVDFIFRGEIVTNGIGSQSNLIFYFKSVLPLLWVRQLS